MAINTKIKDGLLLSFSFIPVVVLWWKGWVDWGIRNFYLSAVIVLGMLLAIRKFSSLFLKCIMVTLASALLYFWFKRDHHIQHFLSQPSIQFIIGPVILVAIILGISIFLGFFIYEEYFLYKEYDDVVAYEAKISAIFSGVFVFLIPAGVYLSLSEKVNDIIGNDIDIIEGIGIASIIGTVLGLLIFIIVGLITRLIVIFFKITLRIIIQREIIEKIINEKIIETIKFFLIVIILGVINGLILIAMIEELGAKKILLKFAHYTFYNPIGLMIFVFIINCFIFAMMFNSADRFFEKYPVIPLFGAASLFPFIWKPLIELQYYFSDASLYMTIIFVFYSLILFSLAFIIPFALSAILKVPYDFFVKASQLEKARWAFISSYPHLLCKKHYTKTRKIRKGIFYSDIRCRINDCNHDNFYIAEKVIGTIGGSIHHIEERKEGLYISLWDEKNKKARSADIDLLRITESKDMLEETMYDYAIDAVYNTLVNDTTRPRDYVRKIPVEIHGNPPLSERALRILKNEFGGIKKRRDT